MSVGLAVHGSGCDIEGDEPTFDGPSPKVVAVRVSVDDAVDEDGVKVRAPIALDGTSVARVTTAVEVAFDRYLDPRTAIRQSYCLRSDAEPVELLEDCINGLGTEPVYDPVMRTLTLYLSEPLATDKVYTLTVLAPRPFQPETGTLGIRAFDSAPLAKNATFSFRTEAVASVTELEALPVVDRCRSTGTVGESFNLLTCTNCHTSSNKAPPQGVSYDAADLPSVVGRVARETQTGADADSPKANPARFGTAMPLVDARNAGNSYLLYKMLALAPVGEDTLADGETERLASTVVVGLPMPATGELAGERDVHIKRISRWISSGAACTDL